LGKSDRELLVRWNGYLKFFIEGEALDIFATSILDPKWSALSTSLEVFKGLKFPTVPSDYLWLCYIFITGTFISDSLSYGIVKNTFWFSLSLLSFTKDGFSLLLVLVLLLVSNYPDPYPFVIPDLVPEVPVFFV